MEMIRFHLNGVYHLLGRISNMHLSIYDEKYNIYITMPINVCTILDMFAFILRKQNLVHTG